MNNNKAIAKCGLGKKYSSTHVMRHSMATITRMVTGGLEASQAVTGRKDQRMVQHPESVQVNAVQSIEAYFNNLK